MSVYERLYRINLAPHQQHKALSAMTTGTQAKSHETTSLETFLSLCMKAYNNAIGDVYGAAVVVKLPATVELLHI